MRQPRGRVALLAALGLGILLMGGCEGADVKGDYPETLGKTRGTTTYYGKRESVFGEGGLSLFGDDEAERPGTGGGGGGIGVNSYLWRASLDTISFLPVNSADPFGGVIITDWHSPAESPDERFKMNVYILGRALRADGVRVAVFRQVKEGGGAWRDASVPDKTGPSIEDAILTRARQLRNETFGQ